MLTLFHEALHLHFLYHSSAKRFLYFLNVTRFDDKLIKKEVGGVKDTVMAVGPVINHFQFLPDLRVKFLPVIK